MEVMQAASDFLKTENGNDITESQRYPTFYDITALFQQARHIIQLIRTMQAVELPSTPTVQALVDGLLLRRSIVLAKLCRVQQVPEHARAYLDQCNENYKLLFFRMPKLPSAKAMHEHAMTTVLSGMHNDFDPSTLQKGISLMQGLLKRVEPLHFPVYTDYMRALMFYCFCLRRYSDRLPAAAATIKRSLAQCVAVGFAMLEYHTAASAREQFGIDLPNYNGSLSFCGAFTNISDGFRWETEAWRARVDEKTPWDTLGKGIFTPAKMHTYVISTLIGKALWWLLDIGGTVTDVRCEAEKILRWIGEATKVTAPMKDIRCVKSVEDESLCKGTCTDCTTTSAAQLWQTLISLQMAAQATSTEPLALSDAALDLHDATIEYLAAHVTCDISHDNDLSLPRFLHIPTQATTVADVKQTPTSGQKRKRDGYDALSPMAPHVSPLRRNTSLLDTSLPEALADLELHTPDRHSTKTIRPLDVISYTPTKRRRSDMPVADQTWLSETSRIDEPSELSLATASITESPQAGHVASNEVIFTLLENSMRVVESALHALGAEIRGDSVVDWYAVLQQQQQHAACGDRDALASKRASSKLSAPPASSPATATRSLLTECISPLVQPTPTTTTSVLSTQQENMGITPTSRAISTPDRAASAFKVTTPKPTPPRSAERVKEKETGVSKPTVVVDGSAKTRSSRVTWSEDVMIVEESRRRVRLASFEELPYGPDGIALSTTVDVGLMKHLVRSSVGPTLAGGSPASPFVAASPVVLPRAPASSPIGPSPLLHVQTQLPAPSPLTLTLSGCPSPIPFKLQAAPILPAGPLPEKCARRYSGAWPLAMPSARCTQTSVPAHIPLSTAYEHRVYKLQTSPQHATKHVSKSVEAIHKAFGIISPIRSVDVSKIDNEEARDSRIAALKRAFFVILQEAELYAEVLPSAAITVLLSSFPHLAKRLRTFPSPLAA